MNLKNCCRLAWAAGAALLWISPVTLGAEPVDFKPGLLWSEYDPDAGDFREEVVSEKTVDGIRMRESYISAYVLGEEIRVYCKYSIKEGVTQAPGLLDVHGWMGAANPGRDMVLDGWAVMAHDYCGKTAGRPQYTRYPDRFRHGNMDRSVGFRVDGALENGQQITDPRQCSDYLWYALERRALSYLERQKEVDRSRLGARGYSYGGTMMWNLGTDPRVKAVVPHFGIGWNVYYREHQVWMYENPPVPVPEPTSGERIFLDWMAPEAHVPGIRAATLFLSGSNDHHGGHERGLESFKRFQPGVPWAFAIQARGHHDTDKIQQNCKMWLDKHVRGRDVFWPPQPRAALRLDSEGVPELEVVPAEAGAVKKLEMFYATKTACSYIRSWRDVEPRRAGEKWWGKLPVLNVDDYVFAFANVTYDTGLVLSTGFEAAIPSRLGLAKETDQRSETLGPASLWTNMVELEGPHGIRGLRPTHNGRGSRTDQFGDQRWQAPPGSELLVKFYCTEPQTLLVALGDRTQAEVEIPASDEWQEMLWAASMFRAVGGSRSLADWSQAGSMELKSKPGSDLTKILIGELRWVKPAK
jgi:dienelactone hydrolase